MEDTADPEWFEQDEEVVQEKQLLEDLDDIMAGDDSDDDDDDNDGGEGNHKGMAELKKVRRVWESGSEMTTRDEKGMSTGTSTYTVQFSNAAPCRSTSPPSPTTRSFGSFGVFRRSWLVRRSRRPSSVSTQAAITTRS